METKKCSNPRCLVPIKPVSEFGKLSRWSSGLQPRCKICMNTYARKFYRSPSQVAKKAKYYADNESRIRSQQLTNWYGGLMSNARVAATNRNHPEPTITKEWILEQYVRQAKKCYHTGVIMIPSEDPRNPFQPSLERLDNDVTYTPENTVLASWAANAARGSSSVEVFREWLSAVRSTG